MSDSATVDVIRQAIDAAPDRRLTFAQYMELALYHPEVGYYSRGRGLGAGGDFATSVHLCADFGETIAIQLAEMWQTLDRPECFDLVEMGAGQGILAGDVLRALRRDEPGCFAAVQYRIVEKSASLKRLQQKQLAEFADKTTWCELGEIGNGAIVGCCLSNELLDAFPVHRVSFRDGQLQEIYVSYDADERFCEILDMPSTPAIASYFADANIDICNRNLAESASANAPRTSNVRRDYPDGYTTEVNLAAKDWVAQISRILDRGYVLTIDYGYDTDRYYAPVRHDGTLNCYSQHRHHPDPYVNPGQQDITAHVDFGAIERWGEAAGLATVGRTQQALFLMALGWGDRLASLGRGGFGGLGSLGGLSPTQPDSAATSTDITRVFQRHQVLRDAIDPQGLGGFQVLVQEKRGTPDETIDGAASDPTPSKRSQLTGLTFPAMP